MKIIFFYLFLNVFAFTHRSEELAEHRNNIDAIESEDLSSPSSIDWTQVPIPAEVLLQYGLYGTAKSRTDPAFPSSNQLWKRANMCHTNTDSPLVSDVQFLIEYLAKDRWNWYCHESYDKIPYCNRLVSHGTAAIGVCGAYRHKMLCQDIGKVVFSILEDCWIKINDDFRIGGASITWVVPRGIQGFRGLVIYHTSLKDT